MTPKGWQMKQKQILMTTNRVTVEDHPRIPKSPTQRSPEAIMTYDAFHARSIEENWVWGEDPRITWCLRHDCATYLEAKKSHCDACGKEAVAFMLSLKVHKPPPKGRPMRKEDPIRRRGDITGRKAGHKQESRKFNPWSTAPKDDLLIFIERR